MSQPNSDQNKIIQKLLKLISLSKSKANQHEADLAQSLAKKMAAKFEINLSSLDESFHEAGPKSQWPRPHSGLPRERMVFFRAAILYVVRHGTLPEAELLYKQAWLEAYNEKTEMYLLFLFIELMRLEMHLDETRAFNLSTSILDSFANISTAGTAEIEGELLFIKGLLYRIMGLRESAKTSLELARDLFLKNSSIPNNAETILLKLKRVEPMKNENASHQFDFLKMLKDLLAGFIKK